MSALKKHLNILILEDIPIDAELTERELQKANFEFTMKRVATRNKFLKELQEFSPDVILADYSLPQFNGLEALRLVREQGITIPYILVTGIQREDVAVECLKQGADDYILKSSLRRLPGALLNALEKREAESEKTRLEDELNRSTHQMISIFESITDAFFVLDNEWNFKYLNPRSDILLARAKKRREDLLGKNWWTEFSIPATSIASSSLRRSMSDRTMTEFEEYFAVFDLWLSVRSYPAEQGLSIYAQDISDRKRNEKIQSTVYRISEAASTGDNLDQVFHRIYQIVNELIPTKNFSIALYDQVRDLITFPCFFDERDSQPPSRKPAGGKTEYVLRTGKPLLVSRDGLKEMLSRNEISTNGNAPACWLGVPLKTTHATIGVLAIQTYDDPERLGESEKNLLLVISSAIALVVERKWAEEKIREQANLLDIAQDAIIERDMDGVILYWNKSAERIYGWTKEEALGKNALNLLRTMQTNLIEAQTTVIQKDGWFGEQHQITRAGKEVIVESRWSLVRDDKGNPKSILMINTDVTDKKQLEQQFLRTQRLENIGILASGIAHDLNNVLAPITMSVPLLKERLSDSFSIDILETLQNCAIRSEGIVKQILSFVQGLEAEQSAIQLRYVVKELARFLRETFPPSIAIKTKFIKDIWPVFGDPTQLQQVLMNLCVNARDAMPSGGTLTLELQNIAITNPEVGLPPEALPGKYVAVIVRDTGSGIPADLQAKIFDPFFTTKEHGKGTGLGLSTVRSIVQKHNGFLRLRSEMGQGTEFTVYLPVNEKAVIAEKPGETKAAQGNGELILVVDDEPSIVELVEATLKSRNYNVLSAHDGTEALAVFAQHKKEIELVLMDMLMPVLDGPTTARAMRKLSPNVRIIAMSGLFDEPHRTNLAEDLGGLPFLQKPFNMEQMLSTIFDVLHGED